LQRAVFTANISDSGSDDIADFSEGIPIEIKSIRVDGGIVTGIHANPMRLLNLTLNDLNSSFLAATVPGSPVYIGTWNESSRGDFIADSFNYFHYIALRNATEDPPFSQILNPLPDFTDVVIDNDNYLNTSCGGGCEGSDGFSPVYFNMSDELGPPDIIGDTLIVAGNKIINSTLIQLIFSPAMSMFDSFISNPSGAQSVGANITIKACAKTFTNPEQPMIGANVSGVITQSFTPGGPPVTEALIVYDPFTSQPTGTVYTGPSGCAVFNVSRSGGWVAGFPNEIKATITTGNLQESAFLGNVFVECTSGCF
jgi:hypothetical protein